MAPRDPLELDWLRCTIREDERALAAANAETLERIEEAMIEEAAARPSLADRLEESIARLFKLSALAMDAGAMQISSAINAEANRLRTLVPLIDPIAESPIMAGGLRALDQVLQDHPTDTPRS